MLPGTPPLITDILLSLDNRFLYLLSWLQGNLTGCLRCPNKLSASCSIHDLAAITREWESSVAQGGISRAG